MSDRVRALHLLAFVALLLFAAALRPIEAPTAKPGPGRLDTTSRPAECRKLPTAYYTEWDRDLSRCPAPGEYVWIELGSLGGTTAVLDDAGEWVVFARYRNGEHALVHDERAERLTLAERERAPAWVKACAEAVKRR